MERGCTPERGQSMVELAITTPLLIIMIFGAFTTVTLVSDRVTAGYAVRQGARMAGQLCGSMNSPGMTQTQIDANVVQNVRAVARTLAYATLVEIDIYRAIAADGTLQTTDLQDQFDGNGNPLATQTFTVDQRISAPPDETSIGVRIVWQ
jgi:Flp pilus assembly protein TadG